MPLNILHIANSYFPEYTGTAARLHNLLINQPYRFTLCVPNRTLKGEKIQKENEIIANIHVKRFSLDYEKGIFDKIPYLRSINTLYQRSKLLVKYSERIQSDIVHGHNPLEFGLAAKSLASKTHKPFVYEAHGIQSRFVNILSYPLTIHGIKKEKEILKSGEHIITLTEPLKNTIMTLYKIPDKKISVVPNGADINRFSSREEYKEAAEEYRMKLGIEGTVVMYAGYLDYVNGIYDLIRIIPPVIREAKNITFVFIGHGPAEYEVRQIAKKFFKNVKFLGVIPYDQMVIYYQMCDVFVIPRPSTLASEIISPLKLFEVMAMEKPVLGSNVGGIAEVIRHGENGYLYEKGNMESFKRTLLEVLNRNNSQIGKNARKTIVDNYTWDKSAKILQKVYEELV